MEKVSQHKEKVSRHKEKVLCFQSLANLKAGITKYNTRLTIVLKTKSYYF
jgi:hypothetical protein